MRILSRIVLVFWFSLVRKASSEDSNHVVNLHLLEEMASETVFVDVKTDKTITKGERVSSVNTTAKKLPPAQSTKREYMSQREPLAHFTHTALPNAIVESAVTQLKRLSFYMPTLNPFANMQKIYKVNNSRISHLKFPEYPKEIKVPLEVQSGHSGLYLRSGVMDDYMHPKTVIIAYSHAENHSYTTTSYLKVVPVTVIGPKDRISIYALLDDGASETMVDEEIANYVGAVGRKKRISIDSIAGKGKVAKVNIVDFSVRGMFSIKKFDLKNVISVPNINVQSQVVRMKDMIKYRHFHDIAEELSYDEASPFLIIGIDNWHLLLPREVRMGSLSEPVAIRTALGWTVFGNVKTVGKRRDSE